jgi:hypothetical protein
MIRHVAWISMLVVSLAGCERQPGPRAIPASTAAPAKTPAVTTSPAPNTKNGDVANDGMATDSIARMDGYGDLRLDMTAGEARKAWGGELKGPVPVESGACHFLWPTWAKVPADFALMIEGDRFVRYDVGTDKETAPGGGKRGMRIAEIRTLYAGRIEERPHKYVPGGKYLRIVANDGSYGVLVFVADASAKITSWRVGKTPQVDYVEGCS